MLTLQCNANLFRGCIVCGRLSQQLNIYTTQIVNYKGKKPENILRGEEDDLPEFDYGTSSSRPKVRLYTMGNVANGALGLPRLLKRQVTKKKIMPRPVLVYPFSEDVKVNDISCGNGFTVMAAQRKIQSVFGTGLCNDSQIGSYVSGDGNKMTLLSAPAPIPVPLGPDTRVTKVACGRAHTVFSTNKEGVWTVGNNAYGQCGRPIVPDEDYSQALFYNVETFPHGGTIEQVECGMDTSFILRDGVIYSCGWSADGQTGLGTYESVPHFGPVEGDLKGQRVVKISCRGDCVLALTDGGDVFGWGNCEYRQFGSPRSDEEQQQMQRSTPRVISLPDIGRVVDVASAGSACFAVNDSGDVFSWGYGILGRGPDELSSSTPKPIPNTLLGRNIINKDSKVVKIYAGLTMAAAVTNFGQLFCWGKNSSGNLGLGHQLHQQFPLRTCISGRVFRVSCGVDHMAVLAHV